MLRIKIIVFMLLIKINVVQPTQNFTLGYLGPTHDNLGALKNLGEEWEAAFLLSVDLVNTQFTDFTFVPRLRDSGVNTSEAALAASWLCCDDTFKSEPELIGVVGAVRSDFSKTVYPSFGQVGIPMISFASTNAGLSNDTKYPLFFRTVPSDDNQGLALAHIVQNYGWKKVGVVTTSDSYAYGLSQSFVDEANNLGITITTFESLIVDDVHLLKDDMENVRNAVDKLRQGGSGVNLISMVTNDADIIFEEIRKQGMYGKGWTWLGTDGSTSSSFANNPTLGGVMQGMLGLGVAPGFGSNYNELMSLWATKLPETHPGLIHATDGRKASPFVPQVYDAVFAYANAVNAVLKDSSTNVTGLSIAENLKLISISNNFTGASGKVFFDANGDGPIKYSVRNLMPFGQGWKSVGSWTQTEELKLSELIVWPGLSMSIPNDEQGSIKPASKLGFPNYVLGYLGPTHEKLGALGELGKEWEAAFRLSLNLVNRDREFEFTFSPVERDSGHTTDMAIQEADTMVSTPLVGVVGAVRSDYSKAAYPSFGQADIPMISFASTNAGLSDDTKYPLFFRTVPSDDNQGLALAHIVHNYGWKKVGVVTTSDSYAYGLSRSFVDEAEDHGITITTFESLIVDDVHLLVDDMANVTNAVDKLRQGGSGVNLISMVTNDAEIIFEEIRKQGMYGKGWTWLGTDGSTSSTFVGNPILGSVMQGMLGLGVAPGFGPNYNELMSVWENKEPETHPGLIHDSDARASSMFVPQVYDAVFAYANAVKAVLEDSSAKVTGLSIAEKLKLINEANNFTGASGKVFFDANGDGPIKYSVRNLMPFGQGWKNVGSWTQTQGLSLAHAIVWPDLSMSIPSDVQGSIKPYIKTGVSSFKLGYLGPTHEKLGSLGELGKEWEAAFRLSVQLVNEDNDMPLRFIPFEGDTGHDNSNVDGAKELATAKVIGVVGAVRSDYSKAANEHLSSKMVPMISFASTNAGLSNDQNYPLFFRTVPSDDYQGIGLAHIVKKYGWTKVGTIATSDSYAQGLIDTFEDEAKRLSIGITASPRLPAHPKWVELEEEILDDEIKKAVTSLKNGGSSVTVISMINSDSEKVFEEVISQKMNGEGWTWLGSDGVTASNFAQLPQMKVDMQGILGFTAYSGSGSKYRKLMSLWATKEPETHPGLIHASDSRASSVFVPQVYDAVLAYAVALQNIINAESCSQNCQEIPDLSVKLNNALSNIIVNNSFDGASGPVYFDNNGDGPIRYTVVNLQEDGWTKVGTWTETDELVLEKSIQWAGASRRKPSHHQPQKTEEKTSTDTNTTLTIVLVLLVILVIGFVALVVHGCYNSKQKGFKKQEDVDKSGDVHLAQTA